MIKNYYRKFETDENNPISLWEKHKGGVGGGVKKGVIEGAFLESAGFPQPHKKNKVPLVKGLWQDIM